MGRGIGRFHNPEFFICAHGLIGTHVCILCDWSKLNFCSIALVLIGLVG